MKHPSEHTRLIRNDSYEVNGKIVNKDDVVRIDGEQGGRFMFIEHVVNTANGAEWITLFELHKGVASAFRSFRPDRLRPIPPKKAPRVRGKKRKVVE